MRTTISNRRRTIAGMAGAGLGAAAAVVALGLVGPEPSVLRLAAAGTDVSGSCDEAEHAGDPECSAVAGAPRTTETAAPTTSTTAAPVPAVSVDPAPAADVRTVAAGEAGSVEVAVEGGTLRLLATSPAAGWRVEVERGAGHEVEVQLASGSRRVDLHVELEDGRLRERVRVRDDATGAETRTEDGVVVRSEPARTAAGDDSGGRGRGGDDVAGDDHAGRGRGRGSDDVAGDDSGGRGRGSDDVGGDDHGGRGRGGDD
jgi:hypothetical protein